MMMLSNGLILIALLIPVLSVKLPSAVPRCKLEDTPCLENTIGTAVRVMKDGNRKINLAPLEPLHVTFIGIDTGTGSFRLKLDLSEVDASGITAIRDIKLESKSTKRIHWIIKGFVPKIEVIGNYIAEGQILVLPVTGNGKANITLYDVDAVLTLKEEPERTKKKDGEYIHLEAFDVVFHPKLVTMHFGNLFNGDKVLGEQLNLFINENWKDVFNEVKVPFEEAIGALFLEITNRVFAKISVEEALLPSE